MQAQPPADFCWIDDIQQRETWDGDSDAGERQSDWEDASDLGDDNDDPMDHDYIEPNYCIDKAEGAHASDPDSAVEVPNFVQVPSQPNTAALPSRAQPLQNREIPEEDVPFSWAPHIEGFFFPKTDTVSVPYPN